MTWAAHAAAALSGEGTVAVALDGPDTAIRGNDDGRRYEIGSVTKTMTATVLALLDGAGTLGLDDPVGTWLSAGANGGITLRQLATHTAGLPALPPNLRPADPADPWAGYPLRLAEDGLREATVVPGWRYSNFGYQLIALVLQRVCGDDFPTLVHRRLLEPLGLNDSGVVAGPGRWAQPWGAGGVECTVADLARYARACLVPPGGPLGAALRRAQEPLVRVDGDREQALGWVVHAGGIRQHSGGTAGYTACVTLDPPRGRGIVLASGTGGGTHLADRFKRASRAVLAGTDPHAAAPPDPCPDWHAVALSAAREFLAGDLDRLHARLAAPARAKLTPERLAATPARGAAPRASGGGPRIVRHGVAANGVVRVDVDMGGGRELRVAVLPTGEVGGLAVL
jgi:serine-type D-Ala-D-Ala carboxypeptidase/endopeptidase